MVYWIVCKEHAAVDERRFGPFESENAARDALSDLRERLLATVRLSSDLKIVCDFA